MHGVIQAVECIPMSDDDSVRATSAFSVRDSLKTDDEDTSQPITQANAKLLRHEFNIMNNSNLVVSNLENNITQLVLNNKKHIEQNLIKMDKIVEEKQNIERNLNEIKEAENESKSLDTAIQRVKSTETASHSLENPKSSTKSGSDVSSGLSKSVPPSYKQKLLQFSRDKLRFASTGNKLTRSIKRSFSRSWDKKKPERQRRTSEPTAEISTLLDSESKKGSKEAKDEDIEKCEVIEERLDDRHIGDNNDDGIVENDDGMYFGT